MFDKLIKSEKRIKIRNSSDLTVNSSDIREMETESTASEDGAFEDDDIIIYDLGDSKQGDDESNVENNSFANSSNENDSVANSSNTISSIANNSDADNSNADNSIENSNANNNIENNSIENSNILNNDVVNDTSRIEDFFFRIVTEDNSDLRHTDNTDDNISDENIIADNAAADNGIIENNTVDINVTENGITDDSIDNTVATFNTVGDTGNNLLENIFFGLLEYEDNHVNDNLSAKMEYEDIKESSDTEESGITEESGVTKESGITEKSDVTEKSGITEELDITERADVADDLVMTEEVLEAAKKSKHSKPAQKTEDFLSVKRMTFIISLALALFIVFLAHGAFMDEMIWSNFVFTTFYVWLVIKILMITDAIMMFLHYRKKALILSVILCVPVYMYFRRIVRNKRLSIINIWLIVSVILGIASVMNFNSLMSDMHLFDKKYQAVMLRFELHREACGNDKQCIDGIIGRHMKQYTYEVVGEESNGTLEVRVAGNSNTVITDIVVPNPDINPNTELFFKVKKNGNYYISGLKMNGSVYNAFADTVWEYWCH